MEHSNMTYLLNLPPPPPPHLLPHPHPIKKEKKRKRKQTKRKRKEKKNRKKKRKEKKRSIVAQIGVNQQTSPAPEWMKTLPKTAMQWNSWHLVNKTIQDSGKSGTGLNWTKLHHLMLHTAQNDRPSPKSWQTFPLHSQMACSLRASSHHLQNKKNVRWNREIINRINLVCPHCGPTHLLLLSGTG